MAPHKKVLFFSPETKRRREKESPKKGNIVIWKSHVPFSFQSFQHYLLILESDYFFLGLSRSGSLALTQLAGYWLMRINYETGRSNGGGGKRHGLWFYFGYPTAYHDGKNLGVKIPISYCTEI